MASKGIPAWKVTHDSLDSDAAVAPSEYLLTTGGCNDDEEGWACDPDTSLAEGADAPLGVTSGRTGCIEVVLIKGKKGKDTVCIVLADEGCDDSSVRMNKVVR